MRSAVGDAYGRDAAGRRLRTEAGSDAQLVWGLRERTETVQSSCSNGPEKRSSR